MKIRILIGTILVVLLLVWPPIYSIYFDRDLKSLVTGRGRIEDFELQRLLDAQRWIIDIPLDKDQWMLGLEIESKGEIRSSGGTSVPGGRQIVLLTRRNQSSKRIEYSWYDSNSGRGGSGSVDDPIAFAGVTSGRPDGLIKIGEPIYRGGTKSVSGFPSPRKADFEVRVILDPPLSTEKDRTK